MPDNFLRASAAAMMASLGELIDGHDVRDARRRTKLAHALKDFGARVQYSVFECLLEADQVERLRLRIERLISAEEDSVRIYRRRFLAVASSLRIRTFMFFDAGLLLISNNLGEKRVYPIRRGRLFEARGKKHA